MPNIQLKEGREKGELTQEKIELGKEKKVDIKEQMPLAAESKIVNGEETNQDKILSLQREIEEKKTAGEAEKKEAKDAVLRELVRYCFRKLILNKPNDKTREEVKKRLMEIASDGRNEARFVKIDKEADRLRDKIVDLIEKKQLDMRICQDIENWLALLFDNNNTSRIFCKQEAVRITNELLHEFA